MAGRRPLVVAIILMTVVVPYLSMVMLMGVVLSWFQSTTKFIYPSSRMKRDKSDGSQQEKRYSNSISGPIVPSCNIGKATIEKHCNSKIKADVAQESYLDYDSSELVTGQHTSFHSSVVDLFVPPTGGNDNRGTSLQPGPIPFRDMTVGEITPELEYITSNCILSHGVQSSYQYAF